LPNKQKVFIIRSVEKPLTLKTMINPIASNQPLDLSSTLVEIGPIVRNLLLLLSDKEKNVVVKRFNLDNSRRHTLEEIGKEFSVTRERIRQIEKNALTKMKRNVFNTALTHIHKFSDAYINDCGGVIKEDALLDKLLSTVPGKENKVDINALRLALFLHDSLDCVGNTIDFYPYIKQRNISDYSLKNIAHKAVNQLQKYGDVKPLSRLERDLGSLLKDLDAPSKAFKSLMYIDKRTKVIDEDKIGLYEWRHIHPRTLRDKIMFILRMEKSPMRFLEIANRISSKNFDNRRINVQAVHNELIRHTQFVLIGRGIYALSEWGYEKGTVADVIKKLLKEKSEMSQEQIIRDVLKQRQVKEITIVLALKNSSFFERVGRKVYRLKK